MPRERKLGDPDDRARLQHMLDAANEALSFAKGKQRSDLDQNRMLVRALCHAILEIGEAANAVSAETRRSSPDVAWPEIIKMRNVLIHVYWGVNLNILWSTIESDLPALLSPLRRAIAALPDADRDTNVKPSVE